LAEEDVPFLGCKGRADERKRLEDDADVQHESRAEELD
jgi:hypothetical protein